MKQYIPKINNLDLVRIVQREFPNADYLDILSLLSKYQSESELGRNRVYAAIIKLSKGDVKLLSDYTSKANDDYRDIIALAEYPRYSRFAFQGDTSESLKEILILDDWNEYSEWIKKL